MPPRTSRPDHRLRLGLTLLLVLQAAGAWLPATWLWGLDHLAWCPVPVRVLVPLIGLVVVWAPFDRPAIRLATLVGERLLNNRVLTYGLLPACGAVAGWLLRDRIHMLGDGLTLSGMLAIDRLFHGFDLMTYHLVARLRQLAGGGDELAAMQTFAIVSWVCGAAWVATAGWAARNLTRHATGRLLLYGLLLFFTPVQLFLGYVEAYAPLAVALLAFFTSVLLYWRGQVRLIVVAATWSVGLFCHLNALFVAPLLLAVLLRPGPGESDPWSQRLLTLVWPPLAALALVVLAYLAAGYDLAALRHDFAHFGEGEGVLVSLSGRDGLLNWRHWKDVLNGVLLLVPLPVLLLTTTRTRDAVRSPSCPHTGWLVGVSGWLLVLLAALHLKLGAPRDWDLLAPHMSLVVLAAWCRVAEDKTGTLFSAAEVIRVLVVALVLCAPWFGLNADAGRSLDRIQAVSTDLAPFPHGLVHEQLANHLRYHDDVTGEAHHLAQASRICPGNPRFSMAYAGHLLKQGHRTEGLAVLDDILARDPDYVPGVEARRHRPTDSRGLRRRLDSGPSSAGTPGPGRGIGAGSRRHRQGAGVERRGHRRLPPVPGRRSLAAATAVDDRRALLLRPALRRCRTGLPSARAARSEPDQGAHRSGRMHLA